MPPTGVAFFVDGDVRVTPGSLGELAQTLDDHPEANAAAAVPMSGRDRLEQTRLVTENHLVLGCFYALRGSFLQKIKARGVRLPAGYIGEDGLVTSLVKADLGIRGQWVKARVAPCPRAGFVFRSLSLARPADWRLYWRRRIRYSLRHIQHELLKPQLMSAGAAALPADVAALYRTGDPARHVRARGVDALFDRIALRRIARARRAD
jgi:cellulose synthase/poly-beta-1,6-N-acetylglucosamine synthase-like glycosyltransferase